MLSNLNCDPIRTKGVSLRESTQLVHQMGKAEEGRLYMMLNGY